MKLSVRQYDGSEEEVARAGFVTEIVMAAAALRVPFSLVSLQVMESSRGLTVLHEPVRTQWKIRPFKKTLTPAAIAP